MGLAGAPLGRPRILEKIMRPYARFLPAILAAVVVGLLSARGVAAHANYERSDPPANTILEQSPAQVRIWYTETPELSFSEIQIYDASSRRIDRGSLSGVPNEPHAVAMEVSELSPGTYTVVWKALSAVDGHTARGAFPFTVGLDQIPTPMVIPDEAGIAGGLASPWGVVSRWLSHVVNALLVAEFVFLPLILGGALKALA